jgi:hypothetical protein
MLVKMWQNGNTYTLLVRIQISTTIMENSMEIPQKVKVELPCDPVILLPGIYPKRTVNQNTTEIPVH